MGRSILSKVSPRAVFFLLVLGLLGLLAFLHLTLSPTPSPTLGDSTTFELSEYLKATEVRLKVNANATSALAFPSFLRANELIRSRFLHKRASLLLRDRKAGEIDLMERSAGHAIWNSFPPTFTCPHLAERIGTAADGGKWICGLELYAPPTTPTGTPSLPCVIYSFGVGGDSSWEVEMVERTACDVWAYDHTVTGLRLPSSLPPELKARFHFTKLGLASAAVAERDDRFRTLGQIMKQNGHDWIDFLKMDVEGEEYTLLPEINEDFDHSPPYGQLNVEIHLNSEVLGENVTLQRARVGAMFELWESLERSGLRGWAWEVNTLSCATFPNFPPSGMEYGFINVGNVGRNRLLRF